jgi:hypothetical protein
LEPYQEADVTDVKDSHKKQKQAKAKKTSTKVTGHSPIHLTSHN